MKAHFCRSNCIGGRLIRLVTFSHWNHVAIELDGYVYEALGSKGVIKTSCDRWGGWAAVHTVSIDAHSELDMRLFLERQVGKPYDWIALLALPFRKDWQREDKWFCSELFAAALVQGGYTALAHTLPNHRVTPKDALIVARLLEAPCGYMPK